MPTTSTIAAVIASEGVTYTEFRMVSPTGKWEDAVWVEVPQAEASP